MTPEDYMFTKLALLSFEPYETDPDWWNLRAFILANDRATEKVDLRLEDRIRIRRN